MVSNGRSRLNLDITDKEVDEVSRKLDVVQFSYSYLIVVAVLGVSYFIVYLVKFEEAGFCCTIFEWWGSGQCMWQVRSLTLAFVLLEFEDEEILLYICL